MFWFFVLCSTFPFSPVWNSTYNHFRENDNLPNIQRMLLPGKETWPLFLVLLVHPLLTTNQLLCSGPGDVLSKSVYQTTLFSQGREAEQPGVHGGLEELWGALERQESPGRMFSYCVRARAYTHVLARVYSTCASTCTLYTCFTLPPTRVDLTGLQV